MKLFILIVIYESVPTETAAYKSLANARFSMQSTRLLLWDNSPKPYVVENDIRSRGLGGSYISTPENLSLSIIYNRVIADWLKPDEVLLLLDQDTQLPVDYFESLAEALLKFPQVNLYLPMVRAHGLWVSPLTYFYGWGRYWKQPRTGLVRAKWNVAINSGMVIRAAYAKARHPVYDERLQLYGVDTQFMVRFSEDNEFFYILNSVISHDLSFYSSSGIKRLNKFLEIKRGYRLIYDGNSFFTRFLVKSVIFLVSLVYAVRYRSRAYLK